MKQKVIKWGSIAQPKQSDNWGKRCYHDHQPLPVTVGGASYEVFGGSCGTPVWEDCDVYVGLDHTMAEHEQRFPWTEGWAIHYKITDGCAPKNATEFKHLIKWLADQVIDNKKVHVGCIGGHGRTGLVLSALVAELTKGTATEIDDPITYVRVNYCKKAVETNEQIEFLIKHFGCKKVEPSKPHSWGGGAGGGAKPVRTRSFSPVPDTKMRIWGDWKVVDKR